MYWPIGVVANNHCGLALYAHIQNEETWVHKKKQSFWAHHKGKCGKGVVDFNCRCEVVVIGIQGSLDHDQGTPNHMYEVKHPFMKYANYTWNGHCVEIYVNTKLELCHCRDHPWLLWDMVWHWSKRIQSHVHKPSFVGQQTNAYNDDEKLDWITNGEGVVDIGGLISPSDDILGFDDVRVPWAQVSDASMEQAMDQLKETMWNITKDYIKGGVALCIHATSLLKVLCANVCINHLMRGYESLHLGNILNRVEDDIGCFVKWKKDWHKWTHKFAHTLKVLNV